MRLRTVALGAILLLSLMACDGFTHIEGRVTDTNGKPIEGAQVEMKTPSGNRDDKGKTDADGSFRVGFTHAPFTISLLITISKEGYKTFERRFTAGNAKQFPRTIALERAQSTGN